MCALKFELFSNICTNKYWTFHHQHRLIFSHIYTVKLTTNQPYGGGEMSGDQIKYWPFLKERPLSYLELQNRLLKTRIRDMKTLDLGSKKLLLKRTQILTLVLIRYSKRKHLSYFLHLIFESFTLTQL